MTAAKRSISRIQTGSLEKAAQAIWGGGGDLKWNSKVNVLPFKGQRLAVKDRLISCK